jgi:uncharacterized RDD family membrane protein YckC
MSDPKPTPPPRNRKARRKSSPGQVAFLEYKAVRDKAKAEREKVTGYPAGSFGAYFVYFWSRSGQTLPMKTWHIRVLRLDGQPLSVGQALLRYVLSFAWWLLPVVAALQMRQHGLGFGAISVVGLLGLLGYAALSRVLPGGQFLHDVIGRTQLITQVPKKKSK